jgi:hypothetical protein
VGLLIVVSAAGALPVPPARAAAIESPGPLRSDRYLTAEQLSGPDWRVEPQATTDGFATTYTVTSRFGSWPAQGRTQVAIRIREIQALAQLEEVSKSEVFLDAVKTSATAPLRLVKGVAEKPKETLKGIPSGVSRWVKKTSFQVKEGYHDAKQVVAKDEEGAAAGGGESESLTEKGKEEGKKYALNYLKISGAERNWYAKLGVDPYTDNELVREAVTSVARVEGLTSFGMKFAGLPGIPGAREMRKTMEIVWQTDPWELRLANRKKLLAAGLSETTARAFEDNPDLSLSLQTALVETLGQLQGVDGRQHVIARAIDVESHDEARTLASSVALMLRFHREQGPLKEFLPGARLPVARSAKGELIAVLLTDALFWTAEVAAAAPEFAALYDGDPAKVRLLLVVGEASPGFEGGARELGWQVRDRWQVAAPEDAELAAPPAGR